MLIKAFNKLVLPGFLLANKQRVSDDILRYSSDDLTSVISMIFLGVVIVNNEDDDALLQVKGYEFHRVIIRINTEVRKAEKNLQKIYRKDKRVCKDE